MKEFSILIGGKAGDGIDKAGMVIARILNRLGLRLYVYRDYPSVIRGGHTFSIIRASSGRIASHLSKVDFILALNQETLSLHRNRLKKDCLFIYDSDQVKIDPPLACGIGLPIKDMLKEENAPVVMRNSCVIGGFCRASGIGWEILEDVFRKNVARETDLNLKVARRGFDAANELVKIEPLNQAALPLITGNEAVGLGLIKGGLDAYIAYPMTPSSPILHFLADAAEGLPLNVIHPENEIGVILMALGFAYMGKKAAVGTSGGGFCLMTEGVSLAGMAEMPVVIVMGQRPGPSTGLPTYSSQTDLHFVLNAGQGEFPRFIAAPGDAEEAYYWSHVALNMAWKYQIPSFILTDKNLGEGTFNFDISSIKEVVETKPLAWNRQGQYKRYLDTDTGVSPLTFAPEKDAIIKVNSYEHDEFGITTEDPAKTVQMQDKRLRKGIYLAEELEGMRPVNIYGNRDSETALLCWGSNKGVCVEAAAKLGLKVIHPIVLWPFPVKQLQASLRGVKKVIAIENNATGQLVTLMNRFGFKVDEMVLKYDGRPLSLDELERRLETLSKPIGKVS